MTSIECKNLVNKYYPDPVLRVWTPSQFDMEYKYNTPRKQKRLEKDREIENARYLAEFNSNVAKKKAVMDVIDRIEEYPEQIKDLFLSTFKFTVEDIVRRHEKVLSIVADIKAKHGEHSFCLADSLKYKMQKNLCTYSNTGRRMWTSNYVLLSDEDWKKFSENHIRFFDTVNGMNIEVDPFEKIVDPKNFMGLLIDYFTAVENDDVSGMGDEAYPLSIRHMADVLSRILDDINRIFCGKKPESCETEVGWGVDGHFNGILKCGEKKASFKSFGAGGYNIQRFHYRFKITLLRH